MLEKLSLLLLLLLLLLFVRDSEVYVEAVVLKLRTIVLNIPVLSKKLHIIQSIYQGKCTNLVFFTKKLQYNYR